MYDESCFVRHWDKPLYPLGGRCLYGKTVGVVGMGGIGAAVTHRLQGFELKRLIYYSR